jgi:hypothetical protein
VMKYFRDKKIGFNAWNVLVPIVSGAVIFDLTVGDPWPTLMRPWVIRPAKTQVSMSPWAWSRRHRGPHRLAGIGSAHEGRPGDCQRKLRKPCGGSPCGGQLLG